MNLPVVELPALAHRGTMRAEDKGDSSWEGHGLSVCRPEDVEDWSFIARLGELPVWQLRNPDARFLAFHDLSAAQRTAVARWGVAQGLAARKWRWSYEFFDDELDRECVTLHPSKAEALEEATDRDDGAEAVSRTLVLCPTQALSDALGGMRTFEDCLDLLAVVYAERETDLDGVWWEDQHGPLSAPRGVILPGRLSLFAPVRA